MWYHEEYTHRVEWEYEHEAEAEQAMKEIVDGFEEWEGIPHKVDLETAQEVQARYRELVGDKTDGDTQ